MKILIATLLGIFTWPLLEYLLHRFLGHVLKLKTLFKKEHTRHHVETDYFAPVSYKLLAAIPVSTITILLASLITRSWVIGASYTIGFVGMFSLYEYVHWSFHAKGPKTKLGLRLRKHHFYHHFHNPKLNHGVTTTLIDHLFGTYASAPIIMVPRKIALPWLFEADKETINPKYTKDFQLK